MDFMAVDIGSSTSVRVRLNWSAGLDFTGDGANERKSTEPHVEQGVHRAAQTSEQPFYASDGSSATRCSFNGMAAA